MLALPGNLLQITMNEISAPEKQGSPHYWLFSKAHIDLRFAHDFRTSVHI
jgi:hypothetical protein